MAQPVHLQDVPADAVRKGDIAHHRRRLGVAAGTRAIGLSHYRVPAGARAMPLHVHGDEEEIFYVLSGRGIGYEEGLGGYPIATGDVIVARPGQRPHTRFADLDSELELLAFGSGSDTHSSYLPRAKVMWSAPHWVPLDVDHPFRAEERAGPMQRPSALVDRPAHVVALADVERVPARGERMVRRLAAAAGSVRAGLNHVTIAPGGHGIPHCHSMEEEAYFVLDGAGTLILGEEVLPVRAGDVIARPPGTAVCHHLTAGESGLTCLVYGTREPGDMMYLPERGVVRMRGLGVDVPVAG
jgi:uncharacterized cupin superfamily protein